MSATLDQIKNLGSNNSTPDTITINYGDFEVNLKANPTITEQINFVDLVVKNTRNNLFNSHVMAEAIYEIFFARYFSDVELDLDNDNVNIDELYQYVKTLSLPVKASQSSPLMKKWIDVVKADIDQQINFQNNFLISRVSKQNISKLADNLNDLLSGTIDQINHFTPEKAKELLNQLHTSFMSTMDTSAIK